MPDDKTIDLGFEIIRCRGCDEVPFRDRADAGDSIFEVGCWPPEPEVNRKEPEWLSFLGGLPPEIASLMHEVYNGGQSELSQARLAAMGIRTTLECMIIDKVGQDRGRFVLNVDAERFCASWMGTDSGGHQNAA